jgi:hypothetical protein
MGHITDEIRKLVMTEKQGASAKANMRDAITNLAKALTNINWAEDEANDEYNTPKEGKALNKLGADLERFMKDAKKVMGQL